MFKRHWNRPPKARRIGFSPQSRHIGLSQSIQGNQGRLYSAGASCGENVSNLLHSSASPPLYLTSLEPRLAKFFSFSRSPFMTFLKLWLREMFSTFAAIDYGGDFKWRGTYDCGSDTHGESLHDDSTSRTTEHCMFLH